MKRWIELSKEEDLEQIRRNIFYNIKDVSITKYLL